MVPEGAASLVLAQQLRARGGRSGAHLIFSVPSMINIILFLTDESRLSLLITPTAWTLDCSCYWCWSNSLSHPNLGATFLLRFNIDFALCSFWRRGGAAPHKPWL